jgi:hypothetical protein
VRGGSLEALRGFLNLAGDADFTLILSWLVAALRPVGPYPLLAITGEPGTAKSTAARTLRALVDPNTAALRSSPREERDCWIAANNAGVLAFDNLSSIPGWLSDALCRVATGGGFATRQLHTDQDEILFDAMRATLLTSVGEVIARSDLADRAIMIELPPIADTERLDEERFRAAFEAMRPVILGALLDAMVTGLQRVAEVSLPRLPRLADFIVWATACEPAFAPAGAVLTAYEANILAAVESVIEGDAVEVALLAFLEKHDQRWQGKPELLLQLLGDHAPDGAKRGNGWPRNPQHLSNRLRLAMPSLSKIGVTMKRGKTRLRGRYIAVSRDVTVNQERKHMDVEDPRD